MYHGIPLDSGKHWNWQRQWFLSVCTGYFVTVQLGNLSVYVHSLIWNFTEYPTNSFMYFVAWRTVLIQVSVSALFSSTFIASSMPFSSCCNGWATLTWIEDQSNRGSPSLWIWEWVGRQEQGDALTSPPWVLKMIIAALRNEAELLSQRKEWRIIVFRVVFLFVLRMLRSSVEFNSNW